MAAFTSKAAGNWSASGQTTWTQTGVPGDGDTVTIGHAVTISGAITVGASGGSGTIAVTINTGGSIVHTAGVATVKGGIQEDGAGVNWTMSPGTAINFVVPASTAYAWNFGSSTCYFAANGSSGSRCTVSATLGSGASMVMTTDTEASPNTQGILTAAYTDFSNFGTSAAFGLTTQKAGAAGTSTPSITNCTFTNCSYSYNANTNVQAGSLTFTGNTFTSSVSNTIDGLSEGVACHFGFGASDTTTGAISGNSFDRTVYWASPPAALTFTGNYVNGGLFTASGAWATTLANNFFAIVAAEGFTAPGPMQDCYVTNSVAVNSHYLEPISHDLTNLIFENTNPANDGQGDVMFPADNFGSPTTINITGCLILPTGGTGKMAGCLTFNGGTGNTTVNLLHNTWSIQGQSALHFDEASALVAGQIGAIKSNLFWGTSKVTDLSMKLLDVSHQTTGGVSNVVSPTNADYNGSFHCFTDEPSVFSGNAYAHAGNGYQANFTAFPGAHDLADQDPLFVDSTRNLASWGVTVGADGTVAGAKAKLAANPALIGQATTGLLAWVRAGWAPTNTAYHNTGHDGTDVGAVPYVSAGATSYTVTGPSTGAVEVASTSFTVHVVGGNATTTITLHTDASGSFTSSPIVYSGTSADQTFTYTPTSGGVHHLSWTASPALGTDPTTIAYTVTSSLPLGVPSVAQLINIPTGAATTVVKTTAGRAFGCLVTTAGTGSGTVKFVDGYTFTDLAIDATNPLLVTSASHAFVASDVGKGLQITAGTGFTVGTIQIVALGAGNGAILASSPGTLASTSGTYNVGTGLILGLVPSTVSITGTFLSFGAYAMPFDLLYVTNVVNGPVLTLFYR